MHIVFTGIQGCGKWTQGRLLQEKYDFKIVEMWGQFRKEIKSWSELWTEIKKVIDAWFLVNDELGGQVMKKAIEEFKWFEWVIFDAFIRIDWNKRIFDSYLSDYKVVFFNLPEEKSKARLLWRMYNDTTWETFMAWTTHDPETWEELVKRKDDNEEAILKRISQYVENTLPLVEEQRKEWRIIEINADQPIEDVFAEIEEKLWLSKEESQKLLD